MEYKNSEQLRFAPMLIRAGEVARPGARRTTRARLPRAPATGGGDSCRGKATAGGLTAGRSHLRLS